MAESIILRLSEVLRLIPDGLPGKTRLGRMLLRPFMSRKSAVLKDRTGNMYVMPSYACMIAQQIFTFGSYERDTVKAIISFLPKGGTFIDIGANIGALTIPVAKALPCVSIICIEADPKLHLLLQQNVDRNNCKQVQVISCVAGARDLADKILISQGPEDRAVSMGAMPSHTELNREILLKEGVPAGVIETFGTANKNTRDEAVALREWSERNAASVFIIPTEIFPARRVRWIFYREFVGTAVSIEIPSVKPPDYTRRDWWKTEHGLVAFQNEV